MTTIGMAGSQTRLPASSNVFCPSATRREFNFDRHWRNARTLVSHNPIAHKARVVGDYLLNAEPPPLTGFF